MTPLTPARLREMIEVAKAAQQECRHPTLGGLILDMDFAEPNAAHIAACDPATIIALCRIALAAADAFRNGPILNGDVPVCDALREAGLS